MTKGQGVCHFSARFRLSCFGLRVEHQNIGARPFRRPGWSPGRWSATAFWRMSGSQPFLCCGESKRPGWEQNVPVWWLPGMQSVPGSCLISESGYGGTMGTEAGCRGCRADAAGSSRIGGRCTCRPGRLPIACFGGMQADYAEECGVRRDRLPQAMRRTLHRGNRPKCVGLDNGEVPCSQASRNAAGPARVLQKPGGPRRSHPPLRG